MLVLGLESSCDETAAALLSFSASGAITVRSEIVASQIDLHAKYGGVVPELASREHLKNFPLVVEQAFERAGCTIHDVTHIGVTCGPGLKGCLLIGVGFARGLAVAGGLPMLGINHIEGHVLAAGLEHSDLQFPYLTLVVSGGHTELFQVDGVGSYRMLGRTIDDAAGEAFDKSAYLLGLPYPGGPALSKLAEGADQRLRSEFFKELPKVMQELEGFSFSGLKTAIALLVKRRTEELKENPIARASLAAAVQDAIVGSLVGKVQKAAKATGLRTLVVTGGVAANIELRKRLGEERSLMVRFPSMARCVDNATMIAYAAGLRFQRGVQGSYSPPIMSRWPLEQCIL